MAFLTLALPNAQSPPVPLADNVLVYDGKEFQPVAQLEWAMLYEVPVAAVTLPYKDLVEMLTTAAYNRAKVLSYDPTPTNVTDPTLVTAPDPSGGTCVCLISCKGTWISYVKVFNV